MIIFAAVIFAACSKTSASLSEIRIATGGVNGTYYAYGKVLAEVFADGTGLPAQARESAASVENIRLVDSGAAEFAFVQNDVMTYAHNGTNLFSADGPRLNFFAVAGLYSEICHIVAARGIGGVAELAGRRVSIGEADSGTTINAAQILEVFGLSLSDIEVVNLGFGDSAQALRDGEIAAFFCTAGIPTPALIELAKDTAFTLLPLSDARRRLLISNKDYYTEALIPPGVYPGVDKAVPAIAVRATLIAGAEISEEDVYTITGLLFENKDTIAAAHPLGAELSPESAVIGIPIPFHPGALRLYREMGILR